MPDTTTYANMIAEYIREHGPCTQGEIRKNTGITQNQWDSLIASTTERYHQLYEIYISERKSLFAWNHEL